MSERVRSNGKFFLFLLIMIILGYIFVLLSLQKVRAEEASTDLNGGEVETVQLSSDSPEVLAITETQPSQEVLLTDEELTDLALLQEELQVYTIVQTYTIETAQSHTDFDCSVCHNAHASSSPKLITTVSVSDLCLSCHYSLLEESRESSNCDLESYDCTICHDIHNATITYSAEETINPEIALSSEPTKEKQTTTVIDTTKEPQTTEKTQLTEPVQDTQTTLVQDKRDTKTTLENEPTSDESPNQLSEPNEEKETSQNSTSE